MKNWNIRNFAYAHSGYKMRLHSPTELFPEAFNFEFPKSATELMFLKFWAKFLLLMKRLSATEKLIFIENSSQNTFLSIGDNSRRQLKDRYFLNQPPLKYLHCYIDEKFHDAEDDVAVDASPAKEIIKSFQ